MEDYKLLYEKAEREVKIADHMAYVTSRLIKDKKIIVSVVDHINKALLNSINSYMYREKMYKRLRNIPEDKGLLIRLFFSKYAKDLNLNKSLESMSQKIMRAMDSYNKQGMMLKRTNKFVVISPSYEVIDFDMNEVRKWLDEAKVFVKKIGEKL